MKPGIRVGTGTSRKRRLHGRPAYAARLLAAAGLLAAGLAPLAGGAPAQADEHATFRVALLNEADSLNPFLGIEAESFEMWALTYDYLIGYSMDDMSVEPALAESWDVSEDGLVWTFDIVEGVTWSDGEALTASDIAYTFNRVLDGGPEAATWGSYLGNVSTIEAPDDTTVVLTLDEPNATLPLIPIPIVPEHIWSDIDEQEVKSFANEPSEESPVVGSGPFRFVEGTAGGSTYRFEANPDYWQGAPHIDEVVFTVYKSEDPAIQALRNGEVDFLEGINALAVQQLNSEANVLAQNGTSPGFDEIAFNVGSVDLDTGEPIGDVNPAVLDPAFRYALGFAIDRDTIIEKAYQGAGSPGTTIIPAAYATYHWEPGDDVKMTFDLERASDLLDEAGYRLGENGIRTLPDGTEMKPLRVFARADSEVSQSVVQFVTEWWEEIGVPTETTVQESSQLIDTIYAGTFDAFEWGWYVEPDPQSMLSYMTCDQRGNWSDSWYCNEEYDALYDAQAVELDPAARAELVKQMQELVYLDAPYLVTAYSAVGEAYRTDRFACFVPQPNPGGVFLIQYGVHNYKNIRPASEADLCEGGADPAASSASDDDGGLSSGAWIGIGAAAAAVVLGGIAASRRGKAAAGDRE